MSTIKGSRKVQREKVFDYEIFENATGQKHEIKMTFSNAMKYKKTLPKDFNWILRQL